MRPERAVRRSGSPLQLAVCEGSVERARGLLRRPPPLPGHALWIVPCRNVHTWGMQYPIDVAFLDERGLVLQVAPNCAPRRVYGDRRAHSVLEFRAGECARLHLRAGERLQLPPAKLRATAPAKDMPRRALPLAMVAALALVVWMLAGCAAPTRPGAAAARVPAVAARASSEEARVDTIDDLRLQADLEYESRAWSRAESAYRELWHRAAADATVRYRLAVALLHLGRHREAADLLEQLEAERPGHADTRQALAVARVAIAADALRHAAATATDASMPTRAVEEPWRVAAERLERLLPPGVTLAPPAPNGEGR